MKWNDLSKEAQDYVDRYIRNKPMTREQALENYLIQAVINEYKNGTKERLVFV